MTSTADIPSVGLDMRLATERPARRWAWRAFAWTALFIVWHGYWALGGDLGFGDQEAAFPDTTSDLAGWAFTITVVAMFAAGLVVPRAVARGRGPRRVLLGLLWAGAAVLAARGLAGLADDALRFTGLAERGLSGLTDEEVLGTAHPSAYTIWSTVGLDAFFAAGAALFGAAAWRGGTIAFAPVRLPGLRRASAIVRARLRPGWTAYAAAGLAIAYAVGVRGYQGLGGRIGIPGTFADPAAFERASLQAGAFLLVVGIGSLGLVRPWGLRLPRWLIIVPALAGSVFAMGHALTAYVTKPLDLLGVIDLDLASRGWARLDEGKAIAWDLLFYEPWFLALGVLVTAGALHHHRRTGGTDRGRRRLVLLTATGTIALTAVASTMVIAGSG